MLVLGLETSCDETGVALYDTSAGLLAHALHSQVAMHAQYGGVVPELASRDHIRRILPLCEKVLADAHRKLSELDAIAYTEGPGLAGALLVGASVGASLGFALGKPALGIHHLEGHLLSPLLAHPAPDFPFVALLVSGGHSQLMAVAGVGEYRLLGETLDDAAGEAFDKTAKLLGLAYPGGPLLSKLAETGDPRRFTLPRPMLHSGNLDMSFSGLKTAVLTLVQQRGGAHAIDGRTKADIARAFQEAMVDVLVAKSLAALAETGERQLVVAGGVGANKQLREQLTRAVLTRGGELFYPPLEFCTDNGAMIALAGALRMQHLPVARPDSARAASSFTIRPRWDLEEIGIAVRS
jgi:N6-L-threonylcarbamoyladenine synthase